MFDRSHPLIREIPAGIPRWQQTQSLSRL